MRSFHIISFVVCLITSGNHLIAQPPSWASLNFPYSQEESQSNLGLIHYSENLQRLIINGKMTYGEYPDIGAFQPEGTHFYPTYDGENWSYLSDCLDPFYMEFNAITDYENGIVVSGGVCEDPDEILNGPLYYDDMNGWQSLGEANGSIQKLKVINDTLYMTGFFTTIGEDSVQYVAKYNGQNWEPAFSNYPSFTNSSVFIFDIGIFQGEWYIGGNFFAEEGDDILVYRNGVWEPVVGEDSAMLVSFASVRSMVVYQEDLYVGGGMVRDHGNVGHNIQRWDGQNWHEVGGSVQGPQLSMSIFSEVRRMIVDQGYLYLHGSFLFAGMMPAPYLVRWDGSQWCAMQTSVWSHAYGPNSGITLMNSQIVTRTTFGEFDFSTFYIHDGETFWPCTEPVSTKTIETDQISIHPNPTSSNLTITGPSVLPGTTIAVYNLAGQQVYGQELSQATPQLVLDARQFGPAGMYLLRVQSPGKAPVVKKVVVQE